MRWAHLGVISPPADLLDQGFRHLMAPTPVLWPDGRLRVFFTMTDPDGRGHPFSMDLDPEQPTRVLRHATAPLMARGLRGTFDDAGAMPLSLIAQGNGSWLMYYAGFETGVQIRYRMLGGCAFGDRDGTWFTRSAPTPILERAPGELYIRSGMCVRREGALWRMWYVAGSEWTTIGDKELPVYDMRYLESDDPLRWGTAGRVVLPLTDPDEHGFGRPWVWQEQGRYHLIYSIRKRSLGAYRLGYAESPDGLTWARADDRLGLEVGRCPLTEQAIMYGAVLPTERGTYVFYNGDQFGLKGFSIARRLD